MTYKYGDPFRVTVSSHGIKGLARTSKWQGVTVVWDHVPNFEFHYPRDLMNEYFVSGCWDCC